MRTINSSRWMKKNLTYFSKSAVAFVYHSLMYDDQNRKKYEIYSSWHVSERRSEIRKLLENFKERIEKIISKILLILI
jgi:hypothetical protein